MGRHENINLLAYSEVENVSGYIGNFDVRVRQKARYIDPEVCTGCSDCAIVCPVEVLNPFDLNLGTRKAAYRHSAQAVPGSYTIEKRGVAPCRDACPTNQRAQGYIALVGEKRYADAYWAIRREHPFPSVCGRVCNRKCEEACSRGNYDEPINIMAIKRFVSDWAFTHQDELSEINDKSLAGTPFAPDPVPKGKKVAIIGAGPAGLTAALNLVRLGHDVKVYDSLPVAGGMMKVGVPLHRSSSEHLDWEIEQILAEGVELQLNTRVDDISALFEEGYSAVMIATGANKAKKLSITNSDHPDNWLSLDLLRRVALGEKMDLSGRKVVVLGGGNVALDVARTVIRLGEPEVRMACLEPRDEMPGFAWEIGEAEEEGIQIFPGRTFKEIMVEGNRIAGIRSVEIEFRGFVDGRPDFDEIRGTEHDIPGDLVIWAIGQEPDLSYLPTNGSIDKRHPTGIDTDPEMMSSLPGVFCAGDLRLGMTNFIVDAIGEGHHVARCIDRYLRGDEGLKEPIELDVVQLSVDEIEAKITSGKANERPRVPIPSIPLSERRNNSREVDLTLTEEQVLEEAERCLGCGVCSECLECVTACEIGAIHHDMQDEIIDLNVGSIILATGFQIFDPNVASEYGYGRLDNVITAMEFERMISPTGPTDGQVLLKNGKSPKSVAILHCVGSRDEQYHSYCSRVCCMYSLKIAQLTHEYVDAEVHEIYRDIRTVGSGHEAFFNRTKGTGVNFYHGKVKSVDKENGRLVVRWDESFHGEPDLIDVEMVILATGFEPRADAGQVASTFGISRGASGFFLERHPKLAPVETSTSGIYLAGGCQSPKDISDSVAQAGGAAAAALSLIDQGTIALEPSIAVMDAVNCAGCGQCTIACPYNAVELRNGTAEVNEYLCNGCGTCAAVCPNKAMGLIHYDDRQIVAELIGALKLSATIKEVS